MNIINLSLDDNEKVEQTAQLLFESFDSWTTIKQAMEDVIESLTGEKISRVVVDPSGQVVGWIAGNSQYNGNVWELHPLVVNKNHRMKGIGRRLVSDFEECVIQRGGITIMLGADDEGGSTTLANVNLYPDIHSHMARFKGQSHPTSFYQKLGYAISGVIPDANGIGKPDIMMAKRVK